MLLRITKNIELKLFEHAEKEAPIEACGYLAGKKGDENNNKAIDVVEIYPMKNTDKNEEHFSFDPKQQFETARLVRQKNLELVAVYHSHPVTPARPSREDISLAYDPEIVYVIVSLKRDAGGIKAFNIKEGNAKEVPIEIKE